MAGFAKANVVWQGYNQALSVEIFKSVKYVIEGRNSISGKN